MHASELFAEKSPRGYVLQAQLGGHGGCWTYAALDADEQPCIVKIMDFAHVQSWKQAELFEREVKVLSNLQHPQIPKVLAVGRSPDDKAYWSYAVFEKMPGQSLEQKLKGGWVATKAEALDIALQALDILQYLHNLQPPVVHRDLKPSNIIQDDTGKIYFIDFGALQGALSQQGSSTVVGSFGYMPPEQFSGRAVPASDIYALAATLLEWSTGLSATEMPRQGLALDLDAVLSEDSAWKLWLKQALAPHLNQRFGSAQEALAALLSPDTVPTHQVRRAVATPLKRMSVQQENETLYIQQQGLRHSLAAFHFAVAGLLPALLTFCLASMFFFGNENDLWPYLHWITALTSLPLLYGTYKALYLSAGQIQLTLTPETLKIKAPGEVAIMGVLNDTSDIQLPLFYQLTEMPLTSIQSVEVEKVLDAYVLKVRSFGKDETLCSGMSGKETAWLQAQILQYLYEHQGGSGARSILVQLKQVRERNKKYFGF